MYLKSLPNSYALLGRWLNLLSQRPSNASCTLLLRVCFSLLALSGPLRLLAEDRPAATPSLPASLTVFPAAGSATGNEYTIGENTPLPSTILAPPICFTLVYVTETGTGDGSSWSNALSGTALAGALSTACTNTTFLIGSGLYKPTITTNQTASFSIASGVQVYGGYTVSGNTGTRPAIDPLNGSPSSTTFSGDIGTSATSDNSYQVVQLKAGGNIRLDGIVITGGNSNQNGGGIYSDGASYTIVNSSIISNTSSAGGGGSYTKSGIATFTNCMFNQNTAFTGGAVQSLSATVSITNSKVANNLGSAGGGGIYGDYSTIQVTSTSLTQNTTSSGPGAAIGLTNPSSLTIANSLLTQNVAADYSNSGGIYASTSAVALITSSSITQNTSGGTGGGIYLSDDSSLTVLNSTISQNTVTNNNGGAGIAIGQRTVATIISTTVNQNIASSIGGGLYTSGYNRVTITDSQFNQNVAIGEYGASAAGLYFGSSSTAIVTGTDISQNTSNSQGAGLYFSGSSGSSLSVVNSTITRNLSTTTAYGGSSAAGIYIGSNAKAYITGVNVTQNTATSMGAGIYFSGSSNSGLILSNSRISQNLALKTGEYDSAPAAGIYLGSSTTAVITSVTVTQNTANTNGGGIYVSGSNTTLTMSNSLFSQNAVVADVNNGSYGAAMYLGGTASYTLTSCTVSQHTSSGGYGGGAVYSSNYNGKSLWKNCVFTQNYAIDVQGGQGGAIYNSSGDAAFTNCRFVNNAISGQNSPKGGAIGSSGARFVSITDCIFEQNSASNGGAVYNGSGSSNSYTVTNCSFSQNTATETGYNGGGGALTNDFSPVIVSNCSFSANTASRGGAIYNSYGAPQIVNSRFTSNTATGTDTDNPDGGGAIYHYAYGNDTKIESCTFTQNTTAKYGGAVFAYSGSNPATLTACVFSQNQAESGGGVFTAGTKPVIKNCQFIQNSATTGGGLMAYSASSAVPVTNSIFSRNTATGSGGAIAADQAIVQVVNSSISKNTAPTGSAIASLSIIAGVSSISLTNDIVWGNGSAPNNFVVSEGSSITIKNSIFEPTSNTATYTDGGNNKKQNPAFTNAANDDLTVAACSPAINAGDDAANSTLTDLANQDRKIGTIDMGAYEFQGPPTALTLTASVSKTLACTGEILPLTASLSGGTSPYSYSWAASTGVTLPASATGSPLSISLVTAGQKSFTITATEASGCTSTTTLSISVVDGVSITAQPVASSAICVGTSVSVPVSVTGSVVSQQWYKGSSPVASQTATTLSLPSTTTADAGDYKLIIATTGCGSLTTSVFSLTVSEPVAIMQQPVASSVVCAGVTVSVPVSVTGAGASYAWYKNGVLAGGQTTATLSLPAATTTDAGIYSLVVTGGCNSLTSTAFSLTVNSTPVLTISPSATLISGGQSAILTASGASSFTWNTASNAASLTVSPVTTTVYSVTGSNNGCVGEATATVSVSCVAVVPAQASPPTVLGVLGAGNCPLSITTQGTGNSFVFTGPDGFVFSNVYRRVGTYPVTVSGIKQPGTFTLTANSTNACGQVSTSVITFVVTGVGCN